MNVRTVKRFSKRTLSTLLSVLMVISLFTVCMSVSTSAYSTSGISIKVDVKNMGSTWTDATNLYIYVGRDKNNYLVDNSSSYVKSYAMTKVSGNTWKWTNSGNWDNYDGFFFSTENNQSGGNSSYGLRQAFKDITDLTHKSAIYTQALATDGTTTYVLEPYARQDVDADLYNYRTKDQISAGSTYEDDCTNGQASTPFSSEVYESYNRAVGDWFKDYDLTKDSSERKATPLYQGNFRQGSKVGANNGGTVSYIYWDYDTGGNNSQLSHMFYHFISVANGTNRIDSLSSGSASAVARFLVDKTLKNSSNEVDPTATITQYGRELPQFSSAFATTYNNKTVSVPTKYADLNSTATESVTFGKIQSSYLDKDFPFEYTITEKGNKRYCYNASIDGNRFFNGTNFVAMGDVYGCKNDVGNWTDAPGYFPFNDSSDGANTVNCFGTRFDIKFEMTETGQFKGEDLSFHFTGDDDVWIYIDGYLALDLGGSHTMSSGYINLHDMNSVITSGGYDARYESNSSQTMDRYTVSKAYTSSEIVWNFTEDATEENLRGIYDSLQDTTKEHTLTVFYLERGTFDSNISIDFILPQSNHKLTVKHDVVYAENDYGARNKGYNDAVNKGIRLETLKVANMDVFEDQIQTQTMAKVTGNEISLPISNTNGFTRKSPDGLSTTVLQQYDSTLSRSLYQNDESSSGLVPLVASYRWQDTAKLFVGNPDFMLSGSAVASGEGVEETDEHGYLQMYYGQSAIFYDQVTPKKAPQSGTNDYARIIFNTQNNLKKAKTTYSSETKGLEFVTSGRKADQYYLSGYQVKDASGQVITEKNNDVTFSGTGQASGDFAFRNADGTTKKVDVTIDFLHEIKTGTFTVEKKLEDGEHDVANPGTDTPLSYTFVVEYRNLFDVKKFDENNTEYTTWKYAQAWDCTVGTVGTDGTLSNPLVTQTGADGTISLTAGQRAEFYGIPVFTEIRITELPIERYDQQKARVTKINYKEKIYNGPNDYSEPTNYTTNYNSTTKPEGDSLTPQTETGSGGVQYSVVKNTPGMKWKAQYDYIFYNSYAETPIIYRYHDRNVVNGKPTTLQTGYTYFAKTVPGAVSTFTDSNGVVTTQAKKDIGEMSPQIINVLSTYRLDNTQGSFYHVEVEKTDSGYTFAPQDGSGFTYTSNTDDVAFNETMQSVFEGKTVGTKIEMIVAEYQDSTRYYDFTVEYVKPGDGTSGDYNSYVNSTTLHKKFNDTVDLGTALAGGDAGLSGETLKNEHYKINVGDRTIYFAYWEREVTYRNGDEVVTSYVPVSTNYNYNYKITQDVHIRAVYKDGNKRYDTQEPYVHYDPDKGWDTTVETNYPGEAHEKTYIRYWKQPAGTTEETDRMYTNSPEQAAAGTYPYNYAQANATSWQWYKLSDEVIGLNGYCLPNESGQMGYAAAATDRMYNSYSKEIVKEVSGTNVYSKQDRTRVDITFGSVGSYDNDDDIQNIGYVLFQNDGSYPVLSDEKINKGAVEDIVKEYVKRQPNLINNADNKINYAVDGTNNGTSYTCLIGKFTVASTAQYSNPNYTAQNIGYVNLTNKNRADIVFDIKNTASSRNKYYTCYTYMIRNGTVYVSPEPTTFSLSEADPSIKNPEGEKSYIVNTKSYAINVEANGDVSKTLEDYDSTTTSAPYGTMNCNVTTTINGRMITFTNRTNVATYAHDGKRYVGEFVKLVFGNETATQTTYTSSDLDGNGQIVHTFTKGTDALLRESMVNAVAYYKLRLAGATLKIPEYDENAMTIYAIVDNGTPIALTTADNGRQVTVPFGATLSVKAVLNTGYQWEATQTTDYTPNGSDYVLDYNNGEATDTTKVLDRTSDTTLTNFFANIPVAEETTVPLTITAGAGTTITIKNENGTQVDQVTSTNSPYTLDVGLVTMVGETYTFSATVSDTTNYELPITWSGAITQTDTTGGTEYTYTLTSTPNLTISAEAQSKGVTIYFSKGTWKLAKQNGGDFSDSKDWYIHLENDVKIDNSEWVKMDYIDNTSPYHFKSSKKIPVNAEFRIVCGGSSWNLESYDDDKTPADGAYVWISATEGVDRAGYTNGTGNDVYYNKHFTISHGSAFPTGY